MNLSPTALGISFVKQVSDIPGRFVMESLWNSKVGQKFSCKKTVFPVRLIRNSFIIAIGSDEQCNKILNNAEILLECLICRSLFRFVYCADTTYVTSPLYCLTNIAEPIPKPHDHWQHYPMHFSTNPIQP